MKKTKCGLYVAPQVESWEIPYSQSILESKSVQTDVEGSIGAVEGEEDFI